ncbi:MAG: hypothetical protein PHV34_19310 [Verrucomicrobiae bacterium]|nr:hypothetical protein [Verrucomicrobiae bacterium]
MTTKMMRIGTLAAVFVLGLASCCWAGGKSAARTDAKPDAGNLRAFVELARMDLKLQKAVIIAQNMEFTEEEAAEFWPAHREYEAEMGKVNDARLELIRQYVKENKTMTDEQARDLAKKVFNLDEKKTDLKRKYFRRFLDVIPAKKAVRFFQIENQLNMAVDLRLAATLPLIK